MTNHPRPSPDDAPAGMTARRLADALELLARDLAAASIRLLTHRHYLPDAVLGREYDSLRALAERLADASVSVRVGSIPVEAHAGAHAPPRPLLDAIEARAEGAPAAPNGEPPKATPARRKREKPPPAVPNNGTMAPADWTPEHTEAFRAALDLGREPAARRWIVKRAKTGEYLGQVVAENLTRAQLAAEERWSHLDRRAIEVTPAPTGDEPEDDDAGAFREQFEPAPPPAPKPGRKPSCRTFPVMIRGRDGLFRLLEEIKAPTVADARAMAAGAYAGHEYRDPCGETYPIDPSDLEVFAPVPARKKAGVAP